MTGDHTLRRLLARVCSLDTMARIVDPTLADMRWEGGRPAWIGYVALAKALLLHALLSTPSVLSRVWRDDERAIPRAAGLVMVVALLCALLLMAVPMLTVLQHLRQYPVGTPFSLLVLCLIPGTLCVTLPAALLLAVPLALRRQEPSSRLARRTIALSICCVAATFVLIAWIVPETNQWYRVLASGQHDLPRGPNETGLAGLRERIAVLNLTPGGQVFARSIEYGYQMRLALVCTPLPISLLALAITASPQGRRRPWLMGVAGLGLYVGLIFPIDAVAERLAIRESPVPPVAFAWMPALLLALVAAVWLARFPSPFFSASPTARR